MMTSALLNALTAVNISDYSLKVESLRSLPGEVGVGATEMAERGRLLVNRSLQVKLLNNVSRSEIEVILDNADDVSF